MAKQISISPKRLMDLKETLRHAAGQHIDNVYMTEDGKTHIQKPKELFIQKPTGKKDPRTGLNTSTKVKKDGDFIGGKLVIETFTRKEILDMKIEDDEVKSKGKGRTTEVPEA